LMMKWSTLPRKIKQRRLNLKKYFNKERAKARSAGCC
jgi:hypothetical protein